MASDPENDFGTRLKRYAQVTGAVGGLAARLAGNRYLGVGLDRDRHAGDLRQALGGLKGPLMKVAQLLATIPDALPREYADELRQLQSNAPPMGAPFVRRRMASELGPEWRARFADFPMTATAAASLGQVHRARLVDGREVAVKLQYADMAAAVDADLAQLKLIFQLYGRYDRAIDTAEIYREIADRLREELDYVRERRHLDFYRMMLADRPEVAVPEPVLALSTARLLTMGWLDGAPLLSRAEAGLETRNRIARAMFHAWYVPFYRYGVIHGDPHLGNYSVAPDERINLLDFGCVRVFEASFVQAVIDLYHALSTGDEELAVHAYRTWGFTDLRRETIRILNGWAEFIYAPLLRDRVQRIQDTADGQYGRAVAEKVHGELRQIGGVTPPRTFVFMDRAAVGLGAVFMHLGAELNWHRLFHELIEGFSADALAARQRATMAQVELPSAA
jgi:predicted unusual protein kinase regulating ubiquinone biosynthesis (AarF/ABC1/UbiB family)